MSEQMPKAEITKRLREMIPNYEMTYRLFLELLKEHKKQERPVNQSVISELTNEAFLLASQFTATYCENYNNAVQYANQACPWWEETPQQEEKTE